MTLFEELGIEYREENGIQYPVLFVDIEGMRLDNVGKYGRMWAGFMEENEPSRYRHLARLHDIAEEVNEEAYERLDNIEAAWFKTHMTGKKTFMEQLHMRNQARMMAEEIVINEMVLKCR